MLDKGKELDWFGSPGNRGIAVVAAIAFACFLIWELPDDHPIVDLSRVSPIAAHRRGGHHRHHLRGVLRLDPAGALWLQTNMGYTASWAGYTTALGGVMAVVMSPIVPRLMGKVDAGRWSASAVASLVHSLSLALALRQHAQLLDHCCHLPDPGHLDAVLLHPDHSVSLSAVLPQRRRRRPACKTSCARSRRRSAARSRRRCGTTPPAATTPNMAGALNDPQGVQRTLGRLA